MAMDEVAASGRVDHLECCRFHGGRGCSSRAFVLAASNDHLAVIRWLLVYYTDQYHPTSIAHASGAVSHWLLPVEGCMSPGGSLQTINKIGT
ncbi:hypothetical protein JG687_00018372 [Phytophthora cactorum]|uniref:Ankyrin repeat-containing domain n=1 Tax=Phytophthora cactorum TaxID=29920 RepID=A0A8T1TPP2_9STRA|nr:hypothetical protein JG687_00018372 [Phytophthora cactorum]